MSKGDIFHFEIKDSAYNTYSFIEFLKNLLQKFLKRNIENVILILENVSFHKSFHVRSLVEESGHKIIYLSPY